MGLCEPNHIGDLERSVIGVGGQVCLPTDSVHIAPCDEQLNAVRVLVVGRFFGDRLGLFELSQRFLDLPRGQQGLDQISGDRQRRAMSAAFDLTVRLQRLPAKLDRSDVTTGGEGSTARRLETGEERVRRWIRALDERLDMSEMLFGLGRACQSDGEYGLLDAIL